MVAGGIRRTSADNAESPRDDAVLLVGHAASWIRNFGNGAIDGEGRAVFDWAAPLYVHGVT